MCTAFPSVMRAFIVVPLGPFSLARLCLHSGHATAAPAIGQAGMAAGATAARGDTAELPITGETIRGPARRRRIRPVGLGCRDRKDLARTHRCIYLHPCCDLLLVKVRVTQPDRAWPLALEACV